MREANGNEFLALVGYGRIVISCHPFIPVAVSCLFLYPFSNIQAFFMRSLSVSPPSCLLFPFPTFCYSLSSPHPSNCTYLSSSFLEPQITLPSLWFPFLLPVPQTTPPVMFLPSDSIYHPQTPAGAQEPALHCGQDASPDTQ